MITVCSDVRTVYFVGRSWKFWMSNLVVHGVTTGYYRNKKKQSYKFTWLPWFCAPFRTVWQHCSYSQQHYCYCTLKQCGMWNWNNFHFPPHNFASYFAVKKSISIRLNKTTHKYLHLTFLVVTTNKLTHTTPCVVVFLYWIFTTFAAQVHFFGIHKTFCLYCNTFRVTSWGALRKVQMEGSRNAHSSVLCGLRNQHNAVCRTSSVRSVEPVLCGL